MDILDRSTPHHTFSPGILVPMGNWLCKRHVAGRRWSQHPPACTTDHRLGASAAHCEHRLHYFFNKAILPPRWSDSGEDGWARGWVGARVCVYACLRWHACCMAFARPSA